MSRAVPNDFVMAQKMNLLKAKSLGPAQYVNQFLARNEKFGPAQNILGPIKGQGIRDRF